MSTRMVYIAALGLLSCLEVSAEWWDLGGELSHAVSEETHGKLTFGGEFRGRYESRKGSAFGNEPDINTGLLRTRLSATWKPVSWIRFSGMMQDSRAPWYGSPAPASGRDPFDLQESYFELFPESKVGFGMSGGRMMLNYGDSRLIGSPQWSNVTRTYDHTRAYYRTARARFEILLVSPVKVRLDGFNRPVLGDRVWGTYNTVANLWRKNGLEWYVLRHDQNRAGGFSGGSRANGTDRLRVNTFGLRITGPVAAGVRYTAEGALQNGTIGGLQHRAGAWASALQRRWKVGGRAFDAVAEYKYASGGGEPGRKTNTFDQLYPANHDKFGHQDLFGWRNIHNGRLLASYALSKSFSLNAMYDNYWLVDAKDALYSGAGKALLRAAAGNAGRHVGQEADVFGTFRYGHLQFGAGYAHFISGGFVKKTSPAINPAYVYMFHNYTF